MSIIKLTTISSSNNDYGPTISGVTTINTTGYVKLPSGTNAERVGLESGSLRYNNTVKLLEFYDGTEWKYIIPAKELSSAIGVFGGGGPGNAEDIKFKNQEYVTISSKGDSKTFGDMIEPREDFGCCSSSTRGISAGGQNFGFAVSDTLEYLTFSTKGSSSSFGILIAGKEGLNGTSNNIRGVFSGNWDLYSNVMEYITIAISGDTLDYGDLSPGRTEAMCVSSPTRGIFAGGYNETPTFNSITGIDYINFASSGVVSTDFGNLIHRRGAAAAVCSNTRGIFGGGVSYTPAFQQHSDMDYITIATTGNAIYFGSLIEECLYFAAASSDIRGVWNMSFQGTFEYTTIATLGNSIEFGGSTTLHDHGNGFSNDHGGIHN